MTYNTVLHQHCTMHQNPTPRERLPTNQLPKTVDCERFPSVHAVGPPSPPSGQSTYERCSWLQKLRHCTTLLNIQLPAPTINKHSHVAKRDANVTKSTTTALLVFAFLFGRVKIRKQRPPTRCWRTERRVARVRTQQRNLRFCDI